MAETRPRAARPLAAALVTETIPMPFARCPRRMPTAAQASRPLMSKPPPPMGDVRAWTQLLIDGVVDYVAARENGTDLHQSEAPARLQVVPAKARGSVAVLRNRRVRLELQRTRSCHSSSRWPSRPNVQRLSLRPTFPLEARVL